MARGGLLRAKYVTGILLDGFTTSISLDVLILILQMRKLRLRGLKGWTRSRRSEGVGCDWHPCWPDCKPGSHSTASLTLPVSQPQRARLTGLGLLREQVYGMSVGTEAWGQGTLPGTALTIP